MNNTVLLTGSLGKLTVCSKKMVPVTLESPFRTTTAFFAGIVVVVVGGGCGGAEASRMLEDNKQIVSVSKWQSLKCP